MDKLTKQWISMLARKVEMLNESELIRAKLAVASEEQAHLRFKFVVEMLVPICREEDSMKRRDLLNGLWSAIDLSHSQKPYKDDLARAETSHEHHIAEIHTLLKQLNDLPED
jgi:hypothetical protein